jgi:putative ABC transport system permease protein
VPVSLDAGLAQDLGVEVGDEIAWDVQGVEIRSRVASLRRIRWARFEPNFFAVFPDGPLRRAPQTFVRLVRLEDGAARARLERRVVAAYANVSVLDLADVEQSLAALIGRLAWAVRFMALFSGAVGSLVLLGSVAASQRQRLREAVLLKTLGATRSQVRRVVLAEYVCLGTLAALAGTALAVFAGSGLLHFVFDTEARAPVAPLVALAAAVVAATAGTGALLGRSVFRHTSLDLLRGE